MMDNFVKNSKAVLRRTMLLLVLIIAISSSVSAQYVERDLAIARLEAKSTQVSQAISSYPPSSLDYRFGLVQLFSYKAIYADLVGNNTSVAAAVDKLFADLGNNTDSVEDYRTTIVEYNKKYKVSSFDVFQVIKNDVKALLK